MKSCVKLYEVNDYLSRKRMSERRYEGEKAGFLFMHDLRVGIN